MKKARKIIKEWLYMFSKEQQEFLKKLKKEDVKWVGEDLYIYDPHHVLGISLGDAGDGWICFWENADPYQEVSISKIVTVRN
jgi:hypothetical protein